MGELFQNGFFRAQFPQDVGSIVDFPCLSFDPSQSHNLWLSTWPLFGFCLLPAFPLLFTPAQPPFHKGQFSKPNLKQFVVICLPRKEWAPLPSFSSPHCDPLPLPFPSGETSLGTKEAAPVEDEHSDS